MRADASAPAQFVARLGESGPEALNSPRDAILPSALGGDGAMMALAVEAGAGDYRAGDQVWCRRTEPADFTRLLNRDVLAPRSGGRFAFGRMIDRQGTKIALLPPGPGQRQVIIDNPPWLAVTEMLVRAL